MGVCNFALLDANQLLADLHRDLARPTAADLELAVRPGDLADQFYAGDNARRLSSLAS